MGGWARVNWVVGGLVVGWVVVGLGCLAASLEFFLRWLDCWLGQGRFSMGGWVGWVV